MNEIYKLLMNIHEIVKANNLFLQSFETLIAELDKKMTIDTQKSEPSDVGAETSEVNE